MDIEQKIIGTWRLVHSVEIDEQGRTYYPFGNDAIGSIMYDASGNMAVQICRRKRNNTRVSAFTATATPELEEISKDYLAYFGSYKIDYENHLVKHVVQGALFPNYVGKILDRKYHFYDDKLSLKPWDGTNREILWQKIPV